ncbi:hypothetical protein SAMN04487910_2819 [Aquimarina amphilecti]|uniref:Lipocalin-like domain-containing protein n=1 Tax=Aquimarina amphilecti TaxID=1038014 RepID=A0A1H7RP14_AQUAM|nr:hypothetical protein [Aquimarina amphilecti]SEL62040.1 hypothetical protein SAMN04487910_2819 [Aquimarina amphilecti]
MSSELHNKLYFLLISILISGFSFSQETTTIIKSLQSNWDLCKYRTDKHFCESNPSILDCDYKIEIAENQFTLFKGSKKIDGGDFEIEHHYDDTFFINFNSSLNDKILELLGANTIKLFNKKEEGFALFIESTTTLFVLKKTQQYLEN